MLMPSQTKKHLQLVVGHTSGLSFQNSKMWLSDQHADGQCWWGCSQIQVRRKGNELHKCLWNALTFLWLFCSLYLKQNKKPQGDFLLAIKPMLPKSAEILLFAHDLLNRTNQRIMGFAETYKAGEELRFQRGDHTWYLLEYKHEEPELCPLKNFVQCLFTSLKKEKNHQVS